MLRPLLALCFFVICLCGAAAKIGPAQATDYFVTIGGGYNPSGNQASLEANVLFFQEVLREQHRGTRIDSIFFADGYDEQADLQIVSQTKVPSGPLSDLLKRLHSRGGPEVDYRNHEVRGVAGPIAPEPIANNLRRTAGQMKPGDRLIIYATAHGEQAKGENKFNTFISCWDNQRFSAKEFTEWLDDVPQEVPVVLVMAQCYCGGFAHTMFNEANVSRGLSARIRCGFFAQQHDLPAAGCRPDIENDEEYSSFFWGAFAGRSRNGKPLANADCNGDGRISFAEAHAQAVVVSQTIDIPLRTSEVLLRQFSRIESYEHRGLPKPDAPAVAVPAVPVSDNVLVNAPPATNQPELRSMSGEIRSLIRGASLDLIFTVTELCRQLSIDIDSDVTRVFVEYSGQQEEFRKAQRSLSRGRRNRGSGRRDVREFRESLAEQWPDLADRKRWRESEFLLAETQSDLMEQVKALPGYGPVIEYFEQREGISKRAEVAELRDVKFQRLINTLEIIVLEQNLPRVAAPEILARYAAILAVEQSTLQSSP